MPRDLIPEEIRQKMPVLYSQEAKKDPMVYAKLYMPMSNWVWFVTECEGDECFGYVIGQDEEFGYFDLRELSEAEIVLPIKDLKNGAVINVPFKAVEYDASFSPKLLSVAKQEQR